MHTRHLTLIEMVLVLTLLAILSFVALNTFSGAFQQTCVEATLKNLDLLQTAILGSPSDLSSGYIATMGKPPTQLENLWINPDPQKRVFGRKEATDQSGVVLYCGWRGPYLILPPGQNELFDGWGNAFELLNQDGELLAEEEPIEIIRSLGADRQVGGSQYHQDIHLLLAVNETAVEQHQIEREQNLYQGTLDLHIQYQPSIKSDLAQDPVETHGEIVIRYYEPDALTGEIRFEDTVLPLPFSAQEDFRRSVSATIGPRAVLVFQGKESITQISEIHYLNVVRGTQPQEIVLVLHNVE